MRRTYVLISSYILFIMYAVIIMYAFLGVLHLDLLENFVTAAVFEIISFITLLLCIMSFGRGDYVKFPFFAAKIFSSAIYSILVGILNMVCILYVRNPVFLLIHMILFFLYCLVFIPLSIARRNNTAYNTDDNINNINNINE
ncbi:MAG: hypothetical protein LUD77_03540 [Clostridiales bacterium]|nr:hypothetical protein [Clostridiales bacterium]